MHLSLADFCDIVKDFEKTNAEKALAVLWFNDRKQPNVAMTSGQMARILDDHRIGTPNPTQLAEAIRRTKFATETKLGFSLKSGSRKLIQEWLPDGIDGMQPAMDHVAGFLPEALWISTRAYVESVSRQINGCYRAAYYDACAVMIRRLLETLIIEAYEHLKRDSEIKNGGGNYFMLKDLVERACGENGHSGLCLSRDTKSTLKSARDIGNWSAHARRYNAFASDFSTIQTGIRVAVQDLIQIANLKQPAS